MNAVDATVPAPITSALEEIFDPCSLATGTPLNVLQMGLVRDVTVDGDSVSITLCATTPSCVLIASIMEGVHDAVARADGVRHVDVKLDAEVFWTPDFMPRQARDELQQRRQVLTRRLKESRQARADALTA